jgi:tetratricopeptide (TPR) repeat protein
VEPNLLAWLNHHGVTSTACALFLPVLLVIPAAWWLARPQTRERTRVSLAIALGPVLVALALVGRHLGGWSLIDGLLLALLVAATAAAEESARPRVARWTWAAAVSVVLGLGAVQLWPTAASLDESALGQPEVVSLIQRDLARWLALRAGPEGAVVLAPPAETTALCYYGGLRGLGTLARENEDGIRAAIRIASASTPEEAKTLIDSRGVTHLISPSWDAYLDEYARLGMGQMEGTFLQRVHDWRLPPWLRPVAYQLPTIAGFEGQTVTIFAVVENQDDAAALSRIAEYFIETGQLAQAAAVSQALRQFPANLGALVARAEVEFAQNDQAAFAQSVERLLPRMTGLNDRQLPWDRRVSLAVALAQAKRMDLARAQVQRCLEKIDAAKLRSLSTGSLYRLQVLGRTFNLPIADPQLHALARDLLPPDLRQRL